MLYNIYAGLNGGFGGADYQTTVECETLEEAEAVAFEYACEEYEGYEGLYGLRTVAEIMEEDEVSEFEANEIWHEERDSWLDYWAEEYVEDNEKNSCLLGIGEAEPNKFSAGDIEKDICEFMKHVDDSRAGFASFIFTEADKGEITKLEAINLLCDYDLLKISNFYDYPDFMENYFADKVQRREIARFSDVLRRKDDFKQEDGSVLRFSSFPKITQKEAIDITYEFMKEKQIIGCVFDW